jgi:hypothetical protein
MHELESFILAGLPSATSAATLDDEEENCFRHWN